MSLSDLASIGSFVSTGAVVVSLIYLSLQIRQAARNQRGTMHQMRAALSTDIMLHIAEQGLSQAFRAGLSGAPDITEAQFWQFFYAASAILRTTENAFTQYGDGLISEPHFATAKASAKMFLASPGLNREPGFRDFMDALAAEAAGSAPADLFAAWKSFL
jgi:hypothetical protein